MATNAIQPQMAVLRCLALQRPMRAANVLVCTWFLTRESGVTVAVSAGRAAATMRPPGLFAVQAAPGGGAGSPRCAYGSPPAAIRLRHRDRAQVPRRRAAHGPGSLA